MHYRWKMNYCVQACSEPNNYLLGWGWQLGEGHSNLCRFVVKIKYLHSMKWGESSEASGWISTSPHWAKSWAKPMCVAIQTGLIFKKSVHVFLNATRKCLTKMTQTDILHVIYFVYIQERFKWPQHKIKNKAVLITVACRLIFNAITIVTYQCLCKWKHLLYVGCCAYNCIFLYFSHCINVILLVSFL